MKKPIKKYQKLEIYNKPDPPQNQIKMATLKTL
jgi:hypothetical protein